MKEGRRAKQTKKTEKVFSHASSCLKLNLQWQFELNANMLTLTLLKLHVCMLTILFIC